MAVLAIILWAFGIATVGLFAMFLFATYRTSQHKKYFKQKGVPVMDQGGMSRFVNFITGRISIIDMEFLVYADAKATNSPFVGYSDSLVAPAFFVTDLNLARLIFVKEFEHFANRRKFTTDQNDILMKKMVANLEDEHWKGLRSKLSPAFTTGKIRRMFQIFNRSGDRMCEYLGKTVGHGVDIDICEFYSKFAMDVIASCAFGVDIKTFNLKLGVLSEFEEMAQKMQFKLNPLKLLQFIVTLISPTFADLVGIQFFDLRPQKYFLKVVKDVLKQRREKGERQDDFLQLLMDAQEGLLKEEENSKESLEVMTGTDDSNSKNPFASSKFNIEDDDIVANCVLFLNAGFETTQSLLILAAYQLAMEQEIQQKLVHEVKTSMEANGGELTYDSVVEMTYLDMFINETLRYFPPATRTERKCTKNFKIPGTDVVIEKGTIVAIPILGIHRDPKYYKNPEKFNPERFLPENKRDRHPYAFTPFGHGPRNCIGMRFALMEAKVVLAKLVSSFQLEPCSQTDIPVKFGNTVILKPVNGMHLKITPRSIDD